MQYFTIILISIFILGCTSAQKENQTMIQKPNIQPHKSKKRLEYGDTCYTLNEKKYTEAESLINEKKSLTNQMSTDIMKNGAALNRIKIIDESLLVIGEPNAYLKQCYFAADNLAPRDLRNTGQQWCAVGLKIIPILKERIDPNLQIKIQTRENEDSQFSMDIKAKQDSLCKI